MDGATTTAMVLAILAAVLSAAALAVSLALYLKASRMAEPHKRFLAALGQMDFPEDLTGFLEALGTVHHRLQDTQRALEQTIEAVRGSIARVGLVRFDAFEEMAGLLSFSLALLDHRANGVLLTGLHRRQSYDAYCRRVIGGTVEHEILPEEREALDEALRGWQAT